MNNKFKHLVTTVDLLNTLNGGVSEPYLSYRERPDGREVRVRVPGVSKELLQVEIHENQLNVVYHVPMETAGKKVFLPKEVIKQTLPYFVDIAGIHATFEENELVVNLPFNELANGYNRKIPIGGVIVRDIHPIIVRGGRMFFLFSFRKAQRRLKPLRPNCKNPDKPSNLDFPPLNASYKFAPLTFIRRV